MYINYWGCELYGYTDMPTRCVARGAGLGYVSTAYWVMFIFIGALVLLTLFIGVVTTGMEEATEDHKLEKDLEDKIEDVRERMGLDAGVIDKYRRAFALIDLDSGGAIPRRSEPRVSSRTEA